MIVSVLVEGEVDEAVARRILTSRALEVGPAYGKHGAGYIRKKAPGFNSASPGSPILCLVDFMDTGLPCPGEVVRSWCPHRRPGMVFRVVVREIESWLLADRAEIARFLGIRRSQIPVRPDELEDPKRTVVSLARRSPRRRIRQMLVPASGTSASEGPGYKSLMVGFARDRWNPDAAAQNSPSLARGLAAIRAAWRTA